MKTKIGPIILLLLLIGGCSIKKNISLKPIGFVPTIDDFSAYYDLEVDDQSPWESNRLIRFFDGTYMIEYEFDDDEAQLAEIGLYYTYMMEFEENEAEAQSTKAENIKIFSRQFSDAIFDARPKTGLQLSCDSYHCTEYYIKDRSIGAGTLLVAQIDNMVVTIFMTTTEDSYENLLEGFFNDYLKKMGRNQGNLENGRVI
ncbi:MAG: hypothetical protein NXI09_07750 [Bacteroidetes bacterium]|nr:hypothetical protein [Bacteroidota bacterium]